jgi:hypothetical protein
VAEIKLDEETLRALLRATSSAEIAEVLNGDTVAQAKQRAVEEAKNPAAPKKPKYISVNGFLQDIPE